MRSCTSYSCFTELLYCART